MKKILEVLLYGEDDIRFNTDMDPIKDPELVMRFGPGITPPKMKS